MTTQVHYLTIQDILWINLQITDGLKKYSQARLEEAGYLQYGHGSSQDVVTQATQFLTKFSSHRPFESGNLGTAFVGFLTFLAMNGKELHLSDEDAYDWVQSVWNDPENAQAKIEVLLSEHEAHGEHGVPETNEIATEMLKKYSDTLERISKEDSSSALFA